MQAGAIHDADEVGVRLPAPTRPCPSLGPGEVGYLIAGIKDVGEARSGETVTDAGAARGRAARRATASPSRWCSAGSTRSTATSSPTSARRSRSCGSTTRASPTSPRRRGALGFGFRCGFLGLLHMEIVRERLEREFDLALIATAPSVEYRVETTDGSGGRGRQPVASCPPARRDRGHRGAVPHGHDPHARREYTGTLMELCQSRRGEMAEDGVPLARAGRARLPRAARRGRASTSSTS